MYASNVSGAPAQMRSLDKIFVHMRVRDSTDILGMLNIVYLFGIYAIATVLQL